MGFDIVKNSPHCHTTSCTSTQQNSTSPFLFAVTIGRVLDLPELGAGLIFRFLPTLAKEDVPRAERIERELLELPRDGAGVRAGVAEVRAGACF